MLLLQACGGEEKREETALFKSVFRTSTGSLRTLDPGTQVKTLKSAEGRPPKHEDSLGLAWELNPGEGREGSAEYFVQNGQAVSLVINAFLTSEAEATRFYQECEDYFRTGMGAPGGNYGNFTFGPAASGLEVNLRMHENNRGLTVNYSLSPTL